MRHRSSTTSFSWIPSEAVEGKVGPVVRTFESGGLALVTVVEKALERRLSEQSAQA